MSGMTELAAATGEAAKAFLGSLDDAQQPRTVMPFGGEEERRSWFYTPTPRPGLYLREMRADQRQAVNRLLATCLSVPGYNHTIVVMGLEPIVDRLQEFAPRGYGDVPGTRTRDPGNYCVAFFGQPGDDAWGWRIGGHHVALQFTVAHGEVRGMPAFFGAEPARSEMPGGVFLRPLAAEEDLARSLFQQLAPERRVAATISPIAPTDIVQMNSPRIEEGAIPAIGGPGPGGLHLRESLGLTPAHDDMYRYSTKPKGLAGRDMSAGEREVLGRLIRAYFEHLAAPIVESLQPRLSVGALDETYFGWAGPGEALAPHYYRVQAPRLLIEYDCTQDGANHTHSVVRDPEADFGDDILAAHYSASHSA